MQRIAGHPYTAGPDCGLRATHTPRGPDCGPPIHRGIGIARGLRATHTPRDWHTLRNWGRDFLSLSRSVQHFDGEANDGRDSSFNRYIARFATKPNLDSNRSGRSSPVEAIARARPRRTPLSRNRTRSTSFNGTQVRLRVAHGANADLDAPPPPSGSRFDPPSCGTALRNATPFPPTTRIQLRQQRIAGHPYTAGLA